MNKELEAFERVKFYAGDTWINSIEWNIIETALKRLEEIDRVMYLNNKKLKAFEIIKKKRVDISVLVESKSLREYTDRICARVNFGRPSEQNLTYLQLAKEEYDLLKEVLL